MKSKANKNKWQGIWADKGKKLKKNIELIDLIRYDGFDTGVGNMTERSWRQLINLARKKLNIKKGNILLEIGCGSGAFIYPLYKKNKIKIVGIDYSHSLLKIAKKVMPKVTLKYGEANKLPFSNDYFDKVISNSVFNYFPNYQYTKKALLEILRVLKSGGQCLILDINDFSKQKYAEDTRRCNLGEKRYNELYKNLQQLYFKKEWFKSFAESHNLRFKIFDQNIKNYKNSEWRFNFYFKK